VFFSFLFLLVIRLYLLKLFLPVIVFAFSPNLLVLDVNDILPFGLKMMSIGLGDLCFQGQGISATYALDNVFLI
jgi:hypothetical protein